MLKFMLVSLSCLLSGITLLAVEFPIATGNYSQTYPEIAFDGNNYYCTFVDKRGGANFYGFYGRFVSPDGDVLPGETEIVPAHNAMSFMHHIARGDDQYLFAWSRQRGPFLYTRDTYARRLDGAGVPVAASFPVSIGNTVSTAFIRTAFDGTNYLVIWQEGMPTQEAHIRAQFVSPTGTLIGQNFSIRPDDLPAGTSQIYPDIEFDGTNYFVVWDDNRTGSRCIYGQFVSPAGDFIGDNIIISTEPANQLLVQAAFNGNHFLVVWADERDNPQNKSIYGQLLDTDGNLIGTHIPISIVVGNIERSWPAVGSNGNQFMVAWEQDIYRSSESQNVNEEREIILSSAGLDSRHQRQLWYDVYGRILNADGAFASDEFPICIELYHQNDPAISSDMNDFLVAWQDSRNQNQYYDIYGLIVEGEAAPSYAPPVNLTAELININEVSLNWEEPLPSDFTLTAYHVYENEELIALIEDPLTVSYLTDGLDDGSYHYHVTAVYEDEFESEPSNEVEIIVNLLPPVEFAAEQENDYVFCSWMPPFMLRGLTSYRLYRNEELLIETEETEYIDLTPEDGLNSYFATAIYDDLYESVATDTIEVYFTSVPDTGQAHLPASLHQNIPNPFNPSTIINYSISEPTEVEITIYDLRGRKVRTLLDEYQQAGNYQIVWNGDDDKYLPVAAGIYFYRLKTPDYQTTRKMLFLK